jgi:hypothetical protein
LKPTLSKLHPKVEPLSLEVKVKVAESLFDRLAGLSTRVVSGATVSMVRFWRRAGYSCRHRAVLPFADEN